MIYDAIREEKKKETKTVQCPTERPEVELEEYIVPERYAVHFLWVDRYLL